MNKWMWLALFGLLVLFLAANGTLWWPAELVLGLLVAVLAMVVGIAAMLVGVPLALIVAALATVAALLVAVVAAVVALLPILLPLALLAGLVWLVVKLASAPATSATPALPTPDAGEVSS